MKLKTIISLIAAVICTGVAVYADGIAVKEARTQDFGDAEYVQYLQKYKDTQVSDIILPYTIDTTEGIEEAVQSMGINTIYSYTVPQDMDISGFSWDNVPETAYGIELDFVHNGGNEIVSGAENLRNALTVKMREFRENANGKKIYVKVPRDMTAAYDMGIDIYTWSDEKLCDVIEVSHTGNGTDTDMPIDFWRKAIDGQIKIYAVIGLNTDIPANDGRNVTLENTAALANMYLSDGADKIYLDNFGIYDGATYEPLREGNMTSESAASVIIRKCGSIKTLADENKRYVVANSITGGADVSQNYSVLPLELPMGGYNRFRIKTGNIPSDATVKLILGVCRGDASNAKAAVGQIFINTKTPAYECRVDNILVDTALSDGEFLVYSVDPSTLNTDSQIIELLSYSNNVYVDYAELRVYPQNDGFIYKNLAAVASENGRNILTAEANKEYTYAVTAENDGIYSVGLCYDSDKKVGIKLNGRGYTLPSSTCLTAHGFAALNLKKGENTITLSADTECVLNYIVFCRADISVTNGDEKEITKYENGLLTVNCGLSGLVDGQELMLIAAVYKDKTLVDTKMKSSTVTKANYTITMPIEVSGGDTLKVYLWNNANTLIPYSDVKIYDKEAMQ